MEAQQSVLGQSQSVQVFDERLWLSKYTRALKIEEIAPMSVRHRQAVDMFKEMGNKNSPEFMALSPKEQDVRKLMAQYLLNIALESEDISKLSPGILDEVATQSYELLNQIKIDEAEKESAIGKIKGAIERHLLTKFGAKTHEVHGMIFNKLAKGTAALQSKLEASAAAAAQRERILQAQVLLVREYMNTEDYAAALQHVERDKAVFFNNVALLDRQQSYLERLPASAVACWNANPALHALLLPVPVATWDKYMPKAGGARKTRRSKRMKPQRKSRV